MNKLKKSRSFRIFISSTFRDMEEERSYIIEQVIPEFKEKASEHGVDVSVIDLRWGITEEESRNGKVLEICLRHIDNCRPLFIGIVGNRYGWCPSPEDFFNNDDLKSNFPEIKDYFNKGMSITEIEMQYGAINTQKETDAIFFIRKNENQHFLKNDENVKVDSLRKKILEDDKILSHEYKKDELKSLELDEWKFGGKLLNWLNSELLKYYPEKGVFIEEEPLVLNTHNERKEYLLQALSENGKSLYPEQIEIILNSPHTKDVAGIDKFVNDLLLYGVFQELNEFINWRASVTDKGYEEFFIRRQLRIYNISMINVIRCLTLSKYGLSELSLSNIFYHNCEYRSNDNMWNYFFRDLKKNYFLESYPYKCHSYNDYECDVLYKINKEHKDFIFDLLFHDEDTIERTRVLTIEGILDDGTIDSFEKSIERVFDDELEWYYEGEIDGVTFSDLDEAYEADKEYQEVLFQKSKTPSLDNYDDRRKAVENLILRNIMGDVPYDAVKGTADYYRLQHAKLRMYCKIFCTIHEPKLLDLVKKIAHDCVHNAINVLPRDEYDKLIRVLVESISLLRHSDNEWISESVDGYDDYLFDRRYIDSLEDIIWYEGNMNIIFKPDGIGKASFRNGDTYEGEWEDGVMQGHGIYERAGEFVYEGEFDGNCRTGKGVLIYLSDGDDHFMGDIYEGEFFDNEFHGEGKYTSVTGDVYEGEFRSSQFNGRGIVTYNDGCRYEGIFHNSQFSGKGRYYYNDGRWYEGMFIKGEMNGEGVLHLPNDAVITGRWLNGERTGLFTLTLPNGETHQRIY